MWSVQTCIVRILLYGSHSHIPGLRQARSLSETNYCSNNNSDHANAMYTCTSMCACRAKWYRYTWFQGHLLWCRWPGTVPQCFRRESMPLVFVRNSCAHMQVPLIAASCCVDPDLVSASGDHRCMLLLHPTPKSSDTCPDLCTLWRGVFEILQSNGSNAWLTNGICYRLQLALVVFSHRHWCKYSNCMCGGITPLQLGLMVFSLPALVQILHSHLSNLHCVGVDW